MMWINVAAQKLRQSMSSVLGSRGCRFPNSWPLRNAGKTAYQVRAHTRSDNVALILSLVREGVGVGRIFGKRCRSCSISAWMGSADSPWRACIDYWAAVAGGMRGVERPPPGVPAALSGAHELDFDLIKPHRVFIPLQAYPRHVRHVEHASLNIVRLL